MERIETLDDLIGLMKILAENEKLDGVGFDMKWPYPPEHCDSACCIGGWINHINERNGIDNIADAFQRVAEVSIETAYEVCYPRYANGSCIEEAYSSATASDAVKVLTALRDTGKVIWPDLFPMKESV